MAERACHLDVNLMAVPRLRVVEKLGYLIFRERKLSVTNSYRCVTGYCLAPRITRHYIHFPGVLLQPICMHMGLSPAGATLRKPCVDISDSPGMHPIRSHVNGIPNVFPRLLIRTYRVSARGELLLFLAPRSPRDSF